MSAAIARLRQSIDVDALLFAVRINVYGFGLMALWSAINTTVLPERVTATAPDSVKGSALGLITFIGVGLAAIVQPIAGRASDAWTRSDPRRPFIVAGALLLLPGLAVFGGAGTFWLLVLGFVVMQLATNISQAAFQAYIPDLVDEDARGMASGAKNILSVLGAASGLLGAQLIHDRTSGWGWVLLFLGAVMLAVAALTVRWVPRIEPKTDGPWPGTMLRAIDPRRVVRESAAILRRHRRFRHALIAQFVFMLGSYPAQRYLLLFLKERFGEDAERLASIGVAIAIVVAVAAAAVAGLLSDAIGRVPVLRGVVAIGGLGILMLGFSETVELVAAAGMLIAVGYGAFLAVNWALLTDDVPDGQAAAALGVANIATAGAGALAGIFGPVVDVMNAFLPQGTYQTLFGLAGLVALLSLVPLSRLNANP
jgi:MFS family permease